MMLMPIVAEKIEDVKVNPTEKGLMEARGYRLTREGVRESVSDTLNRLQIHTLSFFSMHLSDAYIGRLVVYLSTLLCMKYTQLTAPILVHLLDIAGDMLL